MTEIEKFGALINNRIHKVYKARTSVTAEIGIINSGKGLKVGSLSNTIPKGDYLMNDGIEELADGDIVLVIWCENEPVVAAVLKES